MINLHPLDETNYFLFIKTILLTIIGLTQRVFS
jgi:hypothetical protein